MSTNEIIIRLGLTGSGKSLDQTEADVLHFLEEGIEVYCSYWINWAGDNYHYFSDFEEVENLRDAVVVFDEVSDFFDPRDWADEGSRVRRWFRLHRHRHLDIIANTQDISLVAKTIGTLAHRWLYVKKDEPNFFNLLLDKILKRQIIRLSVAEMTYQELKKMAAGWEIGEMVEEQGGFQPVRYNVKKLVHEEFDDMKQEIVYTYCPKCKMRQGKMIRKEETDKLCLFEYSGKKKNTGNWVLKNKLYCGKHKEQELEIKFSSMYDTDYEPEIREREIQFRPYRPIKQGEIWVLDKGTLTNYQLDQKKKLETDFQATTGKL